jgi:Protein of unknown function (DUF4232)
LEAEMIKRIGSVVLVLGATAAGLTQVSASSAATTPNCTSARLRPVFGGSQGAAGTIGDTWRLVNVGTITCYLSGYPAVHNYRSDGRPLPTSVTHTGTPSTVTLTPGQHASFVLLYTNPGILNCTPEPAAMLTIRAPGTALPDIGARGEKACAGKLRETPLVHGG